MSYPTCRVHPRTLSEAFADVRATWGDNAVMNALHRVDTGAMRPNDFAKHVDFQPTDGFPNTYDTSTMRLEAASAVSEFGHDEPRARTVSRWTRIKRYLRAVWVAAFYKP